MKLHRSFALALTILAFGCKDSPTAASEAFSASFTGSTPGAPGGRCPAITVSVVNLPGTGSPGGTFTTLQSHCVDPAGNNPLAFTNGIYTFTYSDGSKVSGTYSGVLVPTADPTAFTVDGEYAITGGSGKFKAATGGGKASGTANLATSRSTLTLTGTIKY